MSSCLKVRILRSEEARIKAKLSISECQVVQLVWGQLPRPTEAPKVPEAPEAPQVREAGVLVVTSQQVSPTGAACCQGSPSHSFP